MLQNVFNILHQELLLYRAALETERQKRSAILAADGRRMQEFTKKSESFVREADALEQKRQAAFDALAGRPGADFADRSPSFAELIDLGSGDGELDQAIFNLVRDQFAPTIRRLKTETEENRRLLENSGHSLHRALTELQNRADPRDETYRADGGKQAKAKGAVLLNANA